MPTYMSLLPLKIIASVVPGIYLNLQTSLATIFWKDLSQEEQNDIG